MTEDTWNINERYLFLIMEFIEEYNKAKFTCDYQTMYNALDSMESTLFPATEGDSVESNLEQIEDNIAKMELKNEAGVVIKYYPKLIRKTVKLMNKTYRELLTKMKTNGMLIKEKSDPNNAMGDFSGS